MPRFRTAIVRTPCKNLFKGLSGSSTTHEPVDYKLALAQHKEYVSALKTSGCQVIQLPPIENYPDSCFVEDTAVCIGNNNVMFTNPGASSRVGEVDFIKTCFANFKTQATIKSPGTLEGTKKEGL